MRSYSQGQTARKQTLAQVESFAGSRRCRNNRDDDLVNKDMETSSIHIFHMLQDVKKIKNPITVISEMQTGGTNSGSGPREESVHLKAEQLFQNQS